MKKILVGLTSTTLCMSFFINCGSFEMFKALANDDEFIDYTQYGLGDIDIVSESDLMHHYSLDELDSAPIDNDLPSCVDLSTTPYFPPIGDQQGLNSCVALATTYYQFTYEANKLNNITTTKQNSYSPAWTFNLWNGRNDGGSVNTVAYEILSEHGAVLWSENPYQTTNGATYATKTNFDFSWGTNTEAMIQALNTRLVDCTEISMPSTQTPISNNQDNTLDEIKSILYGTNGEDGKLLNIRVLIGSNWSYMNRSVCDSTTNLGEIYVNPQTGKTESIAYCASNEGGGHAMTVVGYDDSVWCDINRNGEMDNGELGAFKVANSWGMWENEGYIWVAYDALNKVSSVPGDWESNETGTRISIFDRFEGMTNRFYYINVENKTSKYVGQLTIDTNYRNSLSINAGRSTSSSTTLSHSTQKFKTAGSKSKDIPYNGTIVFDYGYLAEPIDAYISDYNWFVKVNGNHNSLSFKITDNLSNTIVDFGNINTGDSYSSIDLSMGDLDYNGLVDINDSKNFFDATYKNGSLSNLQKYLAKDMNVQTPIHVAVTPSGFDDVGAVLDDIDAYNITWDSISNNVTLKDLTDENYDVLFINCAPGLGMDSDVVKDFVDQGGTVYASDWALRTLINAFPERNFTYETMDSQNLTGSIVDAGLHTSTMLDGVSINFDLGTWFLVNSELQDDVTVYLEGSIANTPNETYPLTFSFPYGDNGGKVFYTSFHYEANNTQEMQSILNELVL